MNLLIQRARMEGFVYFDYAKEFPQAIAEMANLIQQGKLKFRDQIIDGLLKAPESLLLLFSGGNEGKLIIKVSDEKNLLTLPRAKL